MGLHPPGMPPQNGEKPLDQIKTLELGRAKPEKANEAKPQADAKKDNESLDREKLKDALDKTLEVVDLLCPRRHLKYEIIDEADIVQVQVINTDDGSVVRKIPSDDIVKLVEQIHAMLADRFEIEA